MNEKNKLKSLSKERKSIAEGFFLSLVALVSWSFIYFYGTIEIRRGVEERRILVSLW